MDSKQKNRRQYPSGVIIPGPGARQWGTTPEVQNLLRLFKVANLTVHPALPCLSVRNPNQDCGLSPPHIPVFCLLIPLVCFSSSPMWSALCPISRTFEYGKLVSWVSPLSPLMPAPHWPSHKRTQNTEKPNSHNLLWSLGIGPNAHCLSQLLGDLEAKNVKISVCVW